LLVNDDFLLLIEDLLDAIEAMEKSGKEVILIKANPLNLYL